MYTPQHFAEDAAAGLEAVAAYPFAMLVTPADDGGLPPISHLPMMLDPTAARPTLLGHVARANPHGRALEAHAPALAVFSGPSAYISPNWYPSKHAGGQTVPTWNYVAVHVTGRVRPLPDPADKRRVVADLSALFEGAGPQAWRLDDEPEDFVRKMLGGVTAFALEIETVEAKAKLSQNRPEADRVGVIAGLEGADRPSERAVAAAMRGRGIGVR